MAKERRSEELSRTSSLSRAFSRKGKKDKDDKKRLSGLFSRSKESVNSTSSPRASIDKKSTEIKKKGDKSEEPAKEAKEAAATAAVAEENGVKKLVDGAVIDDNNHQEHAKDVPEITKVLDPPLTSTEQEPEPNEVVTEQETSKEPEITTATPEIPIPATSTPTEAIVQSQTPTNKVPPIPIADERQPLLPQEQASSPVYSFLSSPNVSIGLILLVIIVIIVFFCLPCL